MKVAIVVHDLSKKRGHDRYSAELIDYLVQKGIEVDVFANKNELSSNNNLRFFRIPVIRRPLILKILLFLLVSSLIIIKKKYDIIHAQGMSTFKADVITAHICHKSYREVVRMYHKDAGIIRRLYYNIMTYVMSIMERFVFTLPWNKVIIVPSHKVKRELIQHYGIKEDNIKVIYHGVNLNEFNPGNKAKFRDLVRGKYNIEASKKVILFVGEFWRKGLDVVIRAIADLQDTVLIIVGPGIPEPYISLSKILKVSDRVFFAGETDEVNKYYAAADIFVCLSHYESFGLVVTEAMASGIPVIISKEMGVAELIKNFENGIIMNDLDDPVELKEHIKRLTTDVKLYEKLISRGIETVKELSWEYVAQLTLNEYNKL